MPLACRAHLPRNPIANSNDRTRATRSHAATSDRVAFTRQSQSSPAQPRSHFLNRGDFARLRFMLNGIPAGSEVEIEQKILFPDGKRLLVYDRVSGLSAWAVPQDLESTIE